MANTRKHLCRCGNWVEKLTSYFNGKGQRVTLCDNCAIDHGIKNNPDYKAMDYETTQEVREKNINNEFKHN